MSNCRAPSLPLSRTDDASLVKRFFPSSSVVIPLNTDTKSRFLQELKGQCFSKRIHQRNVTHQDPKNKEENAGFKSDSGDKRFVL